MTELVGLPAILVYLAMVNALTVFRFWDDKRRARGGARRISEMDLLGLALAGGTPGAYLARSAFRHKTRKQPFSNQLFAITVMQCCIIAGAAVYFS